MRRAIRRRGTRRLSGKRETEWISGGNGFDLENTVGAVTQFFEIINLVDVLQHQDHLTLVRIVGEVYFATRTIATNVATAVSWGLFKAQCDNTGAFIGLDPANELDDDSEDWIHKKTVFLSEGQGGTPVGAIFTNDYHSAHVDIRVMRKLQGLDQLLFAVGTNGTFGSTNDSIFLGVFLRCLVKLF